MGVDTGSVRNGGTSEREREIHLFRSDKWKMHLHTLFAAAAAAGALTGLLGV